MSSIAIVVPQGFQYTGIALVSTIWLLGWQITNAGRARKAAGIPYPQLYAEKAEAAASKEAQIFNCAQRAHQNTLESIPIIISSTLIWSMSNPIAAASLCGIWSAFRVLYTVGYTTGDPKKRNLLGSGPGSMLVGLGLMCGATWTAVRFLLQNV